MRNDNGERKDGKKCDHCPQHYPMVETGMVSSVVYSQVFFFFFFFGGGVVFLGLYLRHMEVPRLGVKSELFCQPTPQPQQRQIQAASVTYTTAHDNAGSLTH